MNFYTKSTTQRKNLIYSNYGRVEKVAFTRPIRLVWSGNYQVLLSHPLLLCIGRLSTRDGLVSAMIATPESITKARHLSDQAGHGVPPPLVGELGVESRILSLSIRQGKQVDKTINSHTDY